MFKLDQEPTRRWMENPPWHSHQAVREVSVASFSCPLYSWPLLRCIPKIFIAKLLDIKIEHLAVQSQSIHLLPPIHGWVVVPAGLAGRSRSSWGDLKSFLDELCNPSRKFWASSQLDLSRTPPKEGVQKRTTSAGSFQHTPSSLRMSKLLTPSPRLSLAILRRKLISATCIRHLVLSVTTQSSWPKMDWKIESFAFPTTVQSSTTSVILLTLHCKTVKYHSSSSKNGRLKSSPMCSHERSTKWTAMACQVEDLHRQIPQHRFRHFSFITFSMFISKQCVNKQPTMSSNNLCDDLKARHE